MPHSAPLARLRFQRGKSLHQDNESHIGAGILEMADGTTSRLGPLEKPVRLPSDEVMIGLALGSPRDNPLPPIPSDDFNCCYSHGCLPARTSSSPPATAYSHRTKDEGRAVKIKGTRWKLLGGALGRKDLLVRTSQTQPFYQLDRKTQQRKARQQSFSDPFKGCGPRLQKRRRTDTSQCKRTGLTGLAKGPRATEGSALLKRNSSPKRGFRRRKIEEVKPNLPRAQIVPCLEMRIPSLCQGIL